jgi:hypothetical protein
MNLRLIGLGTGAVVFASPLAGCGTLQQDPQCVVAKGSFATVYTPKGTSSCTPLKPEAVALEKYFSADPVTNDSVDTTVALRVRRVGQMVLDAAKASPTVVLDPDAPNQTNSVGALTDVPGPDNFCEAPKLEATQLVSRTPALSLAYAWSNLRIYNTPEIPGTQFTADLTYTENGCVAEYTVKGIWPLVTCEKDEVVRDSEGNPVLGSDGKPKTVKVPDETKCDPEPDPAAGRHRGSGINPIFPVTCHPVVRMCVLTGEVPSDKQP